jgi:hypothetical protein
MIEQKLQIVVYKADEWWIIRGLDREFVTVTRTLEEVPGEIRRFLDVLMAASQQTGVEPFFGYTPAPRRYWEMYERAQPWTVAFPPVPEDLEPGPILDTRLAA